MMYMYIYIYIGISWEAVGENDWQMTWLNIREMIMAELFGLFFRISTVKSVETTVFGWYFQHQKALELAS